MSAEVDPSKRTEAGLQGRVPESTFRDVHVATIEDGEDGMLVAKCPELHVVTQGKNMEDVQRNVNEAVGLMREEQGKDRGFKINIRKKN